MSANYVFRAFTRLLIVSARLEEAHTDHWTRHCQKLSENMGQSYRLQSWWSSALDYQLIAPGETDEYYLMCWGRMVNAYSVRKTTHPGDKLLAFSGVARQISMQWKCNYLAGLFEKLFVHQLFWHAGYMYITPRCSRVAVYRAPSWSWAALDGQIAFDHHNSTTSQIICDVLECVVDTAVASDPFSAVVSGHLSLSAVKVGMTDPRLTPWTYSELPQEQVHYNYDLESVHHDWSVAQSAIVVLLSTGTNFRALILAPATDCTWRRVGIATGPMGIVAGLQPETVVIT